jgi:hypothetical protein
MNQESDRLERFESNQSDQNSENLLTLAEKLAVKKL